jgi:hypothetical protein
MPSSSTGRYLQARGLCSGKSLCAQRQLKFREKVGQAGAEYVDGCRKNLGCFNPRAATRVDFIGVGACISVGGAFGKGLHDVDLIVIWKA